RNPPDGSLGMFHVNLHTHNDSDSESPDGRLLDVFTSAYTLTTTGTRIPQTAVWGCFHVSLHPRRHGPESPRRKSVVGFERDTKRKASTRDACGPRGVYSKLAACFKQGSDKKDARGRGYVGAMS
ncbi:MAG TPA: hypothetical protein VJX67_00655, partial [Blastocatellia bacterium]|nr:hypothetical protein [Blastocatellia bacterium]